MAFHRFDLNDIEYNLYHQFQFHNNNLDEYQPFSMDNFELKKSRQEKEILLTSSEMSNKENE